MDANATRSKRILERAEDAKSPQRILLPSLLKSRNKLRAKYRELRADCKRWRNQAAAVERSRSSWRERAETGEAAAQREQAERIAIEAEWQQIRGQSQEREAELAALRAQLAASEERKKGALNQPDALTAEQLQAIWASSVISPSPSSALVAPARSRSQRHAGCRTAVSSAGTLAATPASKEPEQLPATMPTRSIEPYPVGGQWPVCCIALAVRLVTAAKLSLRSTPRVLAAVFGFLAGRTADAAVMTWTTVRCWLMRLGLYALRRPLEQADDWAYLIDHTVQIGAVKCFAVVGVRLSQLPYPERCLRHEDLQLIVLVPMVHSNAATVEQALEEAALRTGVPRLIVSDQGGDVRGGIERYCRNHRHDGRHLRHGSQGSEPAAPVAGSR